MKKMKKQLKFSETIPISVLKAKTKIVKGGDENKEPKLSKI